MATEGVVKQLQGEVDKLLAFDKDRLLRRNEWGSITFDAAKPNYERIFALANYLKVLPIDILTDETLNQIFAQFQQAVAEFAQIDAFTIESGNPKGNRDSYVERVRQRADSMTTVASPWIPFLAYQKGDVAKNIEKLNTSVQHAADLIDDAKDKIAKRQAEIEGIITKAREASAAAGAAVFTKDFEREATTLKDNARTWLWITGGMALLSLAAAVGFYVLALLGIGTGNAVQIVAAKVAILVVLITATVWCGGIYKALMHQSATNRFRALGLQTFQAFSAGASDAQTKNAVLLETTKAIFADYQTGYIHAKDGGDGETRVVEVFKSVLPTNRSSAP